MSIYTETARFDTGRALTEDEMRKQTPSVFAVTAHESRSARFQPIPTIEILRALTKEGFVPVGAKQSRTRIEGKVEFTKHLIRMRRMDEAKSYAVGDNICEILLKNANDGTSAYELMAGLFRIRCLNSLVAQVGTLEVIKVRHSGDVAGKVIEGTYSVLNEADKVLAAPQDWSGIHLTTDEQTIFADAAHLLRFGDADGNINTPIKSEQLLIPRRYEDKANDLWTTFNMIQENSLKGGLRGVTRDGAGRPHRVKSRSVNGIDQDIKLNKALWTLSQKMVELKGLKAII